MAPTSEPRVLCVEDHKDTYDYVCQMLALAGYRTVNAQTVAEGLRLAKSEHFDLYLLDYALPDGTGLDLCKQIRSFDSRTPIIFHSSHADPDLRLAALEAGAQGYINKMEAFDFLELTITQFIGSGRKTDPVVVSRAGAVSIDTFPQEEFDRFVGRYNADYYFLLVRASTGQYDCLMTSFLVLKDLYSAIVKLHEVGKHEFRIVPYPLSFRSNATLFADLGFNQEEINLIDNFLKFIKDTQGKELDEILDAGVLIQCPVKSDLVQPSP
jgi:CheY-like chemotaxis protein